jgi:hypothetical protein
MKSRSIALILLLAAHSTFTAASATADATCTAGRKGGAALTEIGGWAFSPETGGSCGTGVTSYCIGCHDGLISRTVLVRAPASIRSLEGLIASRVPGFELGAVHRVDIAYPEGRHGFRPASQVEMTLPLNGGRITCETCHSGDVTTPYHLTIPNVASRLCLTCHER